MVSKTKPLSSVVSAIDVSAIKKIELLARATPGTVSLAQGIPSFFTTQHIRIAAIDAINKNLVDKYTPGYGIAELRIAIAEKLATKNNIIAGPSQIIVTHGALEGLMAIFMALLDPDDEVIVPTPNYASHLTQIRIATNGGNPVCVPLRETATGWKLDKKKIEQAITAKTKVILICNPSNPLGKIYSHKELADIASLAIKHNLYIVTDEMYEDFLFDEKKHESIGSFGEVADRTISVFGVSKSYAMTGWRIGYVVATQPLIDAIFKIHDSLVTCPTAVSQYAALAAIKGDQQTVLEYKKEFDKRRKIAFEMLSSANKLTVTKPQAAYYIFPKIIAPIDDTKFCIDLIHKAKVAVVPGSAFGKGGENHVRISFGCDEDTLKEGLKRFVQYVNKEL